MKQLYLRQRGMMMASTGSNHFIYLTIVSLTLYHRYFVGKDTTIFLIALFYIFLRF